MSTAAGLRVAADTVPIQHETSERVVRTIVFAVPPVALGVADDWRGAGACIGRILLGARDHRASRGLGAIAVRL